MFPGRYWGLVFRAGWHRHSAARETRDAGTDERADGFYPIHKIVPARALARAGLLAQNGDILLRLPVARGF